MNNDGFGACDIVPPINPEKMTIEHKTFPDMFRSPSTGFYRSKRRWGQWMLVYDWANLEQDQAMPLIAQFNQFISADMPFTIYDIARPATTGEATQIELGSIGPTSPPEAKGIKATGVTNGQRGRAILLKNLPSPIFPATSKVIFRPGDVIGGKDNGEMYEVAKLCATGPNETTATVYLTNFIRKPLAVGVDEQIITNLVPIKVMGRMQAPDISGGMPIYSFSVEMSETW